jgi:hypothetical protein
LKKSLHSISIATLLAFTSIPAQALDDGLVYVAVDPCRIVDTRGGGGAITANTSRDFAAAGANLSAQGGSNCPGPRAGSTPLAISAYVIAVPPGANSGSGVLTAYPAGNPQPPVGAGSTVNFAANQTQGVGNTTTITLSSGAEFAILARTVSQHVVVDVQGYFYPATGSCSDDMVAVGNVCVDKYEASLVDANGADTTAAACLPDGSDCDNIFAQSVGGKTPATSITYYQAAQACANAGKRLPSTVEWQTAASGTVDPGLNTDLSLGCNTDTQTLSLTGEAQNCQSTAGAFDMIGNVWEYTTELDIDGITTNKFGTLDDDAVTARALGTDYNSSGSGSDTSTKALVTLNKTGFANGALTQSASIGFRCVR